MWLVSFGFSLCYVPINAKMWRVYHICRKPNPSMKNVVSQQDCYYMYDMDQRHHIKFKCCPHIHIEFL